MKKTNLKTPVLFIIFNRPDTTEKVFAEIRKYRPAKLFIAADGPRENKLGEKEKCEQARKITENIDWPCKVKRLYRKKNLGCKYAVSGAIDWFFENVEEGIILEDDCLPNSSFFTFCEQMLKLYKDDNEVMCISGDNFMPKHMQKDAGHYLSRYVHVWGWATWRRAWQKYEADIEDWKISLNKSFLDKFDFLEKVYWSNNFDLVGRKFLDTWDYQLVYMIFNNQGKVVIPNKNLVQNIGFRKDGAHTNTIISSFYKPENHIAVPNRFESGKLREKRVNKFNDKYTAQKVFFINIFTIIYQYLKIWRIIKT